MKFFTPNNTFENEAQRLFNLELRDAFANQEDEPIMFTHLKPCGYVGNRPSLCTDEFHEDDTWAIDQYDEDGENVINSFIYTSEYEYDIDCKLLGLFDDEPDLFEQYENLPSEVMNVLERFSDMENDYDQCAQLVKELKQVGYTCEYGLDGIPHSLRKL